MALRKLLNFYFGGLPGILVVTLFWSGFQVSGWATVNIKIGEVDPLTGGVSQFGIGCHQGFVLAFEEINAAGGVLGQ